MTNYILLSHFLNEDAPTYGNRDKFIIEHPARINQGDSVNSARWTFTSNHIGTHVDLPKHFFDSGMSLSDFKINDFIFDNVQLIEINILEAKLIDVDDIFERINHKTNLLLIRTGFEKFRNKDIYWKENPGLSPNLCDWLKKNYPYIRAIGFDFISLSSSKFRKEGKLAHKILLNSIENKNIIIVEDMSLISVKTNIKKVFVIPIFVQNADGSPVTVIAEI